LHGAANAVQAKMGVRESADVGLLERWLAPARMSVDRAAWEEAYAAGQALPMEDAIALALADPD
jgi:hypothetical protein